MKIIRNNVNSVSLFPAVIVCNHCESVYEAEDINDVNISSRYHYCSFCGHEKNENPVTICPLCGEENDFHDDECSITVEYLQTRPDKKVEEAHPELVGYTLK